VGFLISLIENYVVVKVILVFVTFCGVLSLVGPATAILLNDPAAKNRSAEFKGGGLGNLERTIAAKEQQMAALGAAILSAEAGRNETAEAARIHHSGETGLLMAGVSALQASTRAALAFAT